MNINHPAKTSKKHNIGLWVSLVCFILVLGLGAYFRFIGINWGESQYLHPDERFLVWVGADIAPVKSLSEYFDTQNSSLNPHNRGHGFFVYGTLPLFLARYLVQLIFGHSGFNEMTLVGRPLSALVDLLTLVLVFLTAKRLYNRKVALLAAAFYALSVLPIQLSHFYKEDTFLNLFTSLAIYFAIRVAGEKEHGRIVADKPDNGIFSLLSTPQLLTTIGWLEITTRTKRSIKRFTSSPLFILCVGFGIALGCAVASKLNAAPVAIMLPAAFLLCVYSNSKSDTQTSDRKKDWSVALIYLSLAALVSLLVFRLLQPYAFSGPGFFGLKPNPQWVANIREQRIQSTGDVDFPPALQWARRPVWFAGQNLVFWGLGLPLGILSLTGFFWAGWRMYKGDWQRHILLWGWTAFYFTWQSLTFNPTMRYLLPIYPALVIFAAWTIEQSFKQDGLHLKINSKKIGIRQLFSILVGSVILISTFAWAYAFTRVYTNPVSRAAATRWIYQNIPGAINLHIQTQNGLYNQPHPFPDGQSIKKDQLFEAVFEAKVDGHLGEVYVPHAYDLLDSPGSKTIRFAINRSGEDNELAAGFLISEFEARDDPRGKDYLVNFSQPVSLTKGTQYRLAISLSSGDGEIVFTGAAPAHESTWDDGLPLRLDGYDGYSGIYQSGLNFEMYWDDNSEKYVRFIEILDNADYLFISSNRQWATVPRVPERYPLSTTYYRHLIGCPSDKDILWCYNVGLPGLFHGDLGFDLVQVFESFPYIGSYRINDQFAEEAFTVYDHPKVLIFKKKNTYSSQKVSEILGAVDLNQTVHVTPRQAGRYPAPRLAGGNPSNLMLPEDRWTEQQKGGTWSQLFNTQSWHNRYPFLGALVWYLALTLLGWLVYPSVRLALSGLPDRGYPLTRIAGLLLLSYMVWLAGSFRLPFNRMTIWLIIVILAIFNGYLAMRVRSKLREELYQQRRYYLVIEILFLALFIFDLLIRYGNPDLWHPWKGGEKPMDFSYLNAVLKSTTFPPYDPWFSGGYLNYYYYGFMLVGVLIKLLGIVPSIAYNLFIPSIFGMIALGAFSMAWNLVVWHNEKVRSRNISIWAGLAAALGVAVLGNLGVIRMILQGYQKVVAPGGVIQGANIIMRWMWTIQGFFKVITGTALPFGLGDWYWIPSRVIPAPEDVEPITEFPFFTVLYGDPHAHLFAMPVALMGLAFALSFILAKNRRRDALEILGALLLGSLAIGALRPTNTWDFYTYLPLGCIAVAFSLWTSFAQIGNKKSTLENGLSLGASPPNTGRRLLIVVGGVILLVILSTLLFEPYTAWYGLGYHKIDVWKGTHTPLNAYLTHWGLFLFLIVSWMVWETRDWLASTPVSSLRKLEPYKLLLQIGLFLMVLVVLALMIWGKVAIAWFVLPLAVWTGLLILRPGQSDAKRFVLFLVGTGLVLTLMVEIIVLRGDVGRMNTVFKFYLEVWTFFAVSAAASLGWILVDFSHWRQGWRNVWQLVLVVLVVSAALFPLMGGIAKVQDRMTTNAPHTLDGMSFMAYAKYDERWGSMDFSQDFRAIQWMQENVTGSPVIVEANLRDLYRWGSRYSIYTGLPGVVGWEWHQQQQRALFPSSWVSQRIQEVDDFYNTLDVHKAEDFLHKYGVRYVILGQQERGLYAGLGLDKFADQNGVLWQEVYRDADTSIYEVIGQ